ncbi:predicted protein [Verticillium alfalfae VaMs.102]|uniref:Predicted protein n=1 Tax=Verticillium alfalfae (strain VaMs.102 / ATCC MYA-4576 / FGSC 10136) TaxID=526221 RepID=C9SJ48_VERA1|nr:predicted protein [Verticillium alfalfae VaMs.102]EEY18971.1 predicted protein [Verticillium alfalfae VaMs.102]
MKTFTLAAVISLVATSMACLDPIYPGAKGFSNIGSDAKTFTPGNKAYPLKFANLATLTVAIKGSPENVDLVVEPIHYKKLDIKITQTDNSGKPILQWHLNGQGTTLKECLDISKHGHGGKFYTEIEEKN